MTGFRSVAAAAVISLLTAGPAFACALYVQPRLTDARRADAVVVGYVTRDIREASPERQALIEKRNAEQPRVARGEHSGVTIPDRARLTVEIDHVIAGHAPSTITVFWYRMTNNGPPSEPVRGGYVLALRKLPPSPSETGPDAYAVIQGLCSGALVFRRGSPQANDIREMWGLWPEPLEVAPEAPMEPFKVLASAWRLLAAGGLIAALAVLIALRRRRRKRGRSI